MSIHPEIYVYKTYFYPMIRLFTSAIAKISRKAGMRQYGMLFVTRKFPRLIRQQIRSKNAAALRNAKAHVRRMTMNLSDF